MNCYKLHNHATMDEGKNPTPRIFQLHEAAELSQEIRDLIEALKDERQQPPCGILKSPDNTTSESTRGSTRELSMHERITQLISRMKFLAIALEHGSVSFTEADMHTASILYHNTMWEMFQISKEKSYCAKLDRQRWGQTE